MTVSDTKYIPNGALFEDDPLIDELDASAPNDHEQTAPSKPTEEYRIRLVWRNILFFTYLHIGAIYGVYLSITSAKLLTFVWAYLLYLAGGLGITAGVHRLWSHKGYKAKWPLRVILIIFNTIAHQNDVYEWVRDHRVHHKYTETDADPHNAARGFFYSHVGWLMCRKHPDVIKIGKKIDMSDLEKDSVVMFQRKYYLILMPLITFILPTMVPVFLWGETWSNAWYVSTVFRYVFTLNMTWLVNSAAHVWGNKPYDKTMYSAENLMVSVGALGEGYHNFHHTFPWDYRSSEFGNFFTNPTTPFLHFFAKIGWASDFKTVSDKVIQSRADKTGDGTYLALLKENGKKSKNID